MPVDDVFTATAEVRDTRGDIRRNPVVHWSSTAPTVATVDSLTGEVTTKSDGQAAIVAVSDGKVGRWTFRVVGAHRPGDAVAAPSLHISQSDTVLTVGDSITLTAIRTGPPAPDPTIWEASPVSVAQVDQQGKVVGVAPGVASVSARWKGVTDATTIVVKAPVVATPPPTRTPPSERVAADKTIDKTLDDFVTALDAHNVDVVKAMVDAASWQKMDAELIRPESELRATLFQKGTIQSGETSATIDFKTHLAWTSLGRAKNSMASFRATFLYVAGAWTLLRIQLISELD